MAGYIIYSLDWGKFKQFVERPTPGQLAAFARCLCERLEEYEFDEEDPIAKWPTKPKALAPVAAKRLALPDWYGDLSPSGKALWEGAIFGVCMDCEEIDVGFRVDDDGVYFDVIELAWKQLGVVPGQISDVALAAWGYRPFRYHPETKPAKTRKEYDKEQVGRRAELKELKKEADELLKDLQQAKRTPQSKADHTEMMKDLEQGKSGGLLKSLMGFFSEAQEEGGGASLEEWEPMHSMHTPDEVSKMLAELRSVGSGILKAKKKDVREDYEEALMPAITSVADEGRMLLIQVDT